MNNLRTEINCHNSQTYSAQELLFSIHGGCKYNQLITYNNKTGFHSNSQNTKSFAMVLTYISLFGIDLSNLMIIINTHQNLY